MNTSVTKLTDIGDVRDFGAVPDGSDSTDAFIDALANFKRISVSGGIYDFAPGRVVQVSRDGTRIFGDGGIRGDRPGAGLFEVSANDVQIRNLSFELLSPSTSGVRIKTGAENVHVTRSTFYGQQGYGVSSDEPCKRIWIDSNRFTGLLSYGILLNGNDIDHHEWNISNNQLDDIVGDPIALNSPGTAGLGDSRVIIHGNHVECNQVFAPAVTSSGFGISVAGSQSVVISDNIVRNSRWQGIHVEDSSADVTITGNNVVDTAGPRGFDAGIHIIGGSKITISSNVVSGSVGSGISCDYTPNVPETEVDRIVIANNVVDGSGLVGIRLSTSEDSQGIVSSNTVTNNGSHGLAISGTGTNVTTSDNNVSLNGGYGIVSSSDRRLVNLYTDNIVTKNALGDYWDSGSQTGTGSTARQIYEDSIAPGNTPALYMGCAAVGTLTTYLEDPGTGFVETVWNVKYSSIKDSVEVERLCETVNGAALTSPGITVNGNQLELSIASNSGNNVRFSSLFHGYVLDGKAPDTTLPTTLVVV